MLKCFVSIGTGNPGRKPIAESVLKIYSQTLVGIATQTEDTAKVFIERHRFLYTAKRYFRFNVQQGLQGVGLEEYKKEALISAATAEYMSSQETKSAVQACAVNLKQKQCTSFCSWDRLFLAILGVAGIAKFYLSSLQTFIYRYCEGTHHILLVFSFVLIPQSSWANAL